MNRQFWLKTVIKIAIPVVILVIILMVKFIPMGNDEFSLAKYITLDITGLNEDGDATGSLDQVALYAAISTDETTAKEKQDIEDFIKTITFTLSKSEKLSNGDKITIKVTYDKAKAKLADVKVDSDSRVVKVTGLTSGKELDAFADLKIITSGISPFITVTYSNETENEYLKSLEYSISLTSNLAIGDEITITCNADKDSAADKGYYLKATEMTYTISEADQYISDPATMDQGIITDLAEADLNAIKTETADTTFRMAYQVTHDNAYLYLDNNEKATGFKQYKSVLAYNTTGYEQKHQNYIMVFYKGSIAIPTYKEDDPYKYIDAYFCFLYYDAILKTDGSISMAVNDPQYRYVCGESYSSVLSTAKEEIGTGFEYEDIFTNED